MLAEERFGIIIDTVNKEKSVTVHQLMCLLDASESTIRRDLHTLDSEGKLTKVHGGAIALDGMFNSVDEEVRVREELNTEEKEKIAVYAASLIKDNEFVYVDAGTTTERIINHISANNTVFVTNAWGHAKQLSARGYTTYILGGEVKPDTEAIVGTDALATLAKYNFTKGFFGANGISLDNGFTTPDIKEGAVKQLALSKCKERYVVADNSKFSQVSPVTFAGYRDAVIITNLAVHEQYKRTKNIVEV